MFVQIRVFLLDRWLDARERRADTAKNATGSDLTVKEDIDGQAIDHLL